MKRLNKGLLIGLPFFFFGFLILSGFYQEQRYFRVTAEDSPAYSRVIVASSHHLSSAVEKVGSSLLVKIRALDDFQLQKDSTQSKFVRSLSWAKGNGYYMLTVKTAHSNFSFDTFVLTNPNRLILDITPQESPGLENSSSGTSDDLSLAEGRSEPTTAFQGVKTVIIDPGHGGMANGAHGKFGKNGDNGHSDGKPDSREILAFKPIDFF